jgi:hypothetical protein
MQILFAQYGGVIPINPDKVWRLNWRQLHNKSFINYIYKPFNKPTIKYAVLEFHFSDIKLVNLLLIIKTNI